eukprot:scaffold63788_cov17-Tisochrysis_lutea.AAC.3
MDPAVCLVIKVLPFMGTLTWPPSMATAWMHRKQKCSFGNEKRSSATTPGPTIAELNGFE